MADVRVRNVSEKINSELHNIAKNIGIDFSIFMKQEFRKICDGYPEKMKIPYKEIIVSQDSKIEEKAKMIAELCQPCTPDLYNKVLKNSIIVLKS